MNQHYSPDCQIPTTPYFTWRKEAREAIKAHFENRSKSGL